MYKCKNCDYQGEEAKDNRFCPICGDNVKKVESPVQVPIKEEIKVQDKPKEEVKSYGKRK